MRAISILTLLLVGVLHARRAEACASGNDGIGGLDVAAGLFGAGYVGLTGTFAVKDIVSSDHSYEYGVAETAWNGSLMVMAGTVLAVELHDPAKVGIGATTLGVITAIHGALFVHGIYTLVKPSGSRNDKKPAAIVAPTALPDGAGLGLSGTF